MESILTSIKKLLGIQEEYTHFDSDIIMHINAAISLLSQLGIGPKNGLIVTDNTVTWTDLLGDSNKIEHAKTYVYLKVKMLFDPPLSSAVAEAMNRMLSEMEWRLTVSSDSMRQEENQNGV